MSLFRNRSLRAILVAEAQAAGDAKAERLRLAMREALAVIAEALADGRSMEGSSRDA